MKSFYVCIVIIFWWSVLLELIVTSAQRMYVCMYVGMRVIGVKRPQVQMKDKFEGIDLLGW